MNQVHLTTAHRYTTAIGRSHGADHGPFYYAESFAGIPLDPRDEDETLGRVDGAGGGTMPDPTDTFELDPDRGA